MIKQMSDATFISSVSLMAIQTDETFATLSVMYSGDGDVPRHLVRRMSHQSSKNVVRNV